MNLWPPAEGVRPMAVILDPSLRDQVTFMQAATVLH
jgi:hypothetical protein